MSKDGTVGRVVTLQMVVLPVAVSSVVSMNHVSVLKVPRRSTGPTMSHWPKSALSVSVAVAQGSMMAMPSAVSVWIGSMKAKASRDATVNEIRIYQQKLNKKNLSKIQDG